VSGEGIDLDGVTLRYGAFVATQSVGFSLPPGQFLALAGPAGCPESSVLNIVAGFLAPTQGKGRLVRWKPQPAGDPLAA
jgi:ABC-type Fe3+/spermidine/putrescine transport system ATPase subunit